MEFLKIKVNLPKKVYDILINDMECFGFTKSDGSVNKNGFINTLLKMYFSTFTKNENETIRKVVDQAKIKEEVFEEIYSLLFEETFKKEGNYNKDLQFIISKDNKDLCEEIFDFHLRNRSISQFFREMFILYSVNPQDKREEILFKSIINKINLIIKNNKKALIYFKNNSKKEIDLYQIVPTKEEYFNYILGVIENNKKREIVSYHLYDISNVIEIEKKESSFSKEEKEKLELTIFQNPAFAINRIEDVEVELSEVGLRLFNLWVHDRPNPYKVEGNKYFFKACLIHIAIYFFKFASEAKILKPKLVKDFIVDRLQIALDMYKDKL